MARFVPSFYGHHARWFALLWGMWVLLTALSAGLYFFGPPLVPLWYSLVVPSEQLAPSLWLASFPALSGSIALIATWHSRRTALEHSEFLARVSIWGGIMILGFLLVALIRIMKVIL